MKQLQKVVSFVFNYILCNARDYSASHSGTDKVGIW